MSTPPRLVLDTNILLSALIFSHGQLAWVRRAWQQECITALTCKQTTCELLRVLAYPKFRLSCAERNALLEDFLPYAHVVTLPDSWPTLPVCRDSKDQVFLALAQAAGADALLTGDADLLALRDTFAIPIRTAREWAAMHPQLQAQT